MLGEVAMKFQPYDADLDARAYDDALGSGTLREHTLRHEGCERSHGCVPHELPAAGFRMHK
jgi:hypothetical protein